MKYLGFYTPTLFLILCLPTFAGETANVSLFFSPQGGCEATICNTINAAKSEILVAAYSFSSKPIARALYTATKRGVTVQVILDRKQPTMHYSMANDLAINGLAVRIDRREPSMHQKTMILDRNILIAGSYNFTASAEHRNAEILTVIISKKIAAQAAANWLHHWQHSTPHDPSISAYIHQINTSHHQPDKITYRPSKPTNYPFRPRFRRILRWSNLRAPACR